MKLDQLKFVIEIARSGSISKAAKKLLMTQPNLSTAIKSLEDELGFEIFERNSVGITVTQKGQELLKYADTIQDNINMINGIKHSNNLMKSYELNVSSDMYTLVFDKFLDTHNFYKTDKTRFNFNQTNYYQVIEDVYSKDSSIGYISISEDHMHFFQSLFSSKGLLFTPLTTAKVHLYVLDKHPLYHKDSVTFDDLNNTTMVFCNLVDPYFIYHKLNIIDKLANVKNIIHISNPASAVTAMISENAGCLLLKFDTIDIKKFYGIGHNYKYFDVDGPKVVCGWIRRQDHDLTPIESTFIDNLTNACSK